MAATKETELKALAATSKLIYEVRHLANLAEPACDFIGNASFLDGDQASEAFGYGFSISEALEVMVEKLERAECLIDDLIGAKKDAVRPS